MRGLIGPWSLEEVYCGNPQLTFVTKNIIRSTTGPFKENRSQSAFLESLQSCKKVAIAKLFVVS